MALPDFERARRYAVQRLEHDLAPELTYHSRWHTCADVVPATERLAVREGVTGDELLLLRTAAFFHDVGFVERRTEHEAAGVAIARAVLPGFGYDEEALTAISAMIMATRLPQEASGTLARILADADLDVLGREDFWQRNQLLRAELATLDTPVSDAQWWQSQLRFLENHRYWTAAARSLRDERKASHIAELRKRLASLAG